MAYRRRFSRSSPPAQGFAPTAFPHMPGGCLQILANAGAAKNGPMRDLGRLGGGLIGVSLASLKIADTDTGTPMAQQQMIERICDSRGINLSISGLYLHAHLNLFN